MEQLKAEGKIQVYNVKEINNLADMLNKQHPTYKVKARTRQVQECGQLMEG